MMPFLLAELAPDSQAIPLYVSCVGSHHQRKLVRPGGFPEHQLFLTRSGTGRFRIAGRADILAPPGTALLLPAGIPHEYESADPDAGWLLGFAAFGGPAADAIAAQTAGIAGEARMAPDFERLWTALEALYQAADTDGPAAAWEASRRMYAMLTLFLEGQSGGAKRPMHAASRTPGTQHGALQAAVRLMHDHCGERLTLVQIARAVGYSVQHLHRLFAAQYGMTPQQYWLQLRMRMAVRLLDDHPEAAVGMVAEQVGMEPSYFIRMFKRTYGQTPHQYRKR